MFEKWMTYRQIDELRRENKLKKVSASDHDRRQLFPIAVIDDKPFHYEQSLRANNYVIEYLGDINSLEAIKPFNIIACDLQGVGTRMNARGQGAYIIDEIKRSHPEKFVIAYTGGSPDDFITIRAQEIADFFLKKDAEIDDWRDNLDHIISELSNPLEVWKRQRDALVEADVPTLDILRLEDAYVNSILHGSAENYKRVASNVNLSSDLRSIAQSLVASGIFRVLIA